MLYDRDQAFGGSQLTQLISRQYGFRSRRPSRRSSPPTCPGLRDRDPGAVRRQPVAGDRSRLQYFFTSTPHHKVHYVMLAGGTATLPGLKGSRDRADRLRVDGGQPVREHAARLGRACELRREAPSYLTACGLAMRRFLQ